MPDNGLVDTPIQSGQTVPAPRKPGQPVKVNISWAGDALDAYVVLTKIVNGKAVAINDEGVVYFQKPLLNGVKLTSGLRDAVVEIDTDELERAGATNVFIGLATEYGQEKPAAIHGLQCVTGERADGDTVSFAPQDLDALKTFTLVEVYSNKGTWKVRAHGLGWKDKPVERFLTEYGIQVDEGASNPTSPTPVSLQKAAQISLQKNNLSGRGSRVALVVDGSESMRHLLRDGSVTAVARRAAALAEQMDADKKLDVFRFSNSPGFVGSFGLNGLPSFDESFITRTLEYRSPNGDAGLPNLVDHYFGNDGGWQAVSRNEPFPVLAIYFTNENLIDLERSQTMLAAAGNLAMFAQFMGIGPGEFPKSRQLSEMPGRVRDNAGFHQFQDPLRATDADVLDGLLAEYPNWMEASTRAGLVLPDQGRALPTL